MNDTVTISMSIRKPVTVLLLLIFIILSNGCLSLQEYTPGHHELPEPEYVPPPVFPEETRIPGPSHDPDKKDLLVITSSPGEVQVYFDETYMGTTPLELKNISESFIRIRLSKPGYRDINETFFFIKSENTRHYILEQLTGVCSIKVVPADAAIYIDDNRMNGDTFRLPVGTYKATIKKFGYADYTLPVVIAVKNPFTARALLSPVPCTVGEVKPNTREIINPLHTNLFIVYFTVHAPGSGTFSVFNADNTAVFTAPLHHFTTEYQSFSWDMKDISGAPVPDGRYKVTVSVTDPDTQAVSAAETSIEINSLVFRSPHTTYSGISGLQYTATPDTLPFLNMQLDASVSVPVPPDPGIPFPVRLGFRIGAWENLETLVCGGLLVLDNGEVNTHGSLAVKYRFLDSNDDIHLSISAFSRLTLNSGTDTVLQANPTGITLGLPLSLSYNNFHLVFAPEAIYATTPFPYEIIPDTSAGHYLGIFAKGGLYYENPLWHAGISGALFFTQDNGLFGPIMPVHTAVEFTFNVPNTGFFISGSGMVLFYEKSIDFYAGFGLGLLW